VRSFVLVHLAWAPLGVTPLERFLTAYLQHPVGVEHRFLVVMNGFTDEGSLGAHRSLMADVPHTEVVLKRSELDLGAYHAALEASDEDVIAFTNSYSEPLVDRWLALLDAHLRQPAVGMVGATGSYESALTAAPRPLKPVRALAFPSFPNPHLRTNAFALERALAERLHWPRPRGKGGALRLESGRRGLTRQISDEGLAVLVVGRDGRAYEPARWPDSHTFRSGDQENLLVADNRTHQYARADEAERRRLAAMAWGT
jgi:hypothetical protein